MVTHIHTLTQQSGQSFLNEAFQHVTYEPGPLDWRGEPKKNQTNQLFTWEHLNLILESCYMIDQDCWSLFFTNVTENKTFSLLGQNKNTFRHINTL